ncbi:MAG: TnpV protein, partial [Blautia wexlerae]
SVTEELKMQDQMEWVRRRNNIKNVVEGMVLLEMIYA